jgi:hypothetical protein
MVFSWAEALPERKKSDEKRATIKAQRLIGSSSWWAWIVKDGKIYY